MSAVNGEQGFTAIDWGTSSFRLRALDGSGRLVAQSDSANGVARLGRDGLLPFLQAAIAGLPDAARAYPIILCGMVGSNIGLQAVPYAQCPLDPATLADQIGSLSINQDDLPPLYIVPGVSARGTTGELEVMRGEETQIVGWLQQADAAQKRQSLLCLPGTHAKWAQVRNGQVEAFTTAMTGELYALLSEHSVLVQGEQQFDDAAFRAGVEASRNDSTNGGALLQQLFSARTRVLDGKLQQQHSAAYLSGLLIGSEVRHAIAGEVHPSAIQLIGSERITRLYRDALHCMEIDCQCHDGESLALAGLAFFARQIAPRQTAPA